MATGSTALAQSDLLYMAYSRNVSGNRARAELSSQCAGILCSSDVGGCSNINHIPAVLQGPHFSQSVLSIFGTAYHMTALIFLACMLSNMVLTFLCFYVCISFYCAPLSLSI